MPWPRDCQISARQKSANFDENEPTSDARPTFSFDGPPNFIFLNDRFINQAHYTFCKTSNSFFSRAILCYLVNKYGEQSTQTQHLYPKDPELRANVDRMLFYDSGSLYKNVIDYFVGSFYMISKISKILI